MLGSPNVPGKSRGNRSSTTTKSSLKQVFDNFIKRAFDIVVSFIALIFLLPAFALVSILIHRDSRGPIFYKCPRMGKGGRPFIMHKFRTMYEEPKSYNGSRITYKEDERITPLGQWLRNTKINEWPQFWNVLVGEMSLVGPRPEDIEIATQWPEEISREILSVRPGITSPASILYHDEQNLLSKTNVMEKYLNDILPDKLRLDQLYVRNHSFVSDIDILFWTAVIFFPRISRTRIPESYLFAGPFYNLINRYISWFLIDLVISLIVTGLAILIWRLQGPLNWGAESIAILAIFMAVIFSGINSITGLNRIIWSKATLHDGLGLILSGSCVMVALLIMNILLPRFAWFPYPPLPMAMILFIGILAQAGFLLVRYRLRMIIELASRWLVWRKGTLAIGERVLIVGAGENFSIANWLLRRKEYHQIFSIVGVVDDDIPTSFGMRLEGCLVLGRLADIPSLVEKEKIEVIVFTTSKIPAEIKRYTRNLVKTSSVRLVFLDTISDIINRQLSLPLMSPEYELWSEDYLRFMSMHDSVTGLPNRTLFQDRLVHSIAMAKRYQTHPIVVFFNINGREQYESIGKDGWDTIVKGLIKNLQKFKRESDTLAFLGGCEFAFLFENIPDETAIHTVIMRLSSFLNQPVQAEDQVFQLPTTICVCQEISKYIELVEKKDREAILDYLVANRTVVKIANG